MLLPAVTRLTTGLIRAAFMIFGDESARLPVRTNVLAVIGENVRLSSKVLPVVSIDTLSLIVLFIEWAPFCLKVKHIKISIFFHLMNKSGFEFFRIMSERTIVTIFTFVEIFRIFGAVF